MARDPVTGSGAAPAWICAVSNRQFSVADIRFSSGVWVVAAGLLRLVRGYGCARVSTTQGKCYVTFGGIHRTGAFEGRGWARVARVGTVDP
ncbi:hypothetical protein GCM10022240_20190 [Microbacterium kribbense]|uniref:Uncharacterized protein n=1 Tax=Microbacterium kribbense TaxID=433645 RepID=A0ABP7GR38_9MICO